MSQLILDNLVKRIYIKKNHDARTLLKTAMGVEEDDELKHGVRADDVLSMFKYVQALYKAEGRIMNCT